MKSLNGHGAHLAERTTSDLQMTSSSDGVAALQVALELEHEPDAAAPSSNGPPASAMNGVVIGRVEGFARQGEPLVSFAGNDAGRLVAARNASVLPLKMGQEVALMFLGGNRAEPIVIGPVQNFENDDDAGRKVRLVPNQRDMANPVSVSSDGEQLVLSAEREIVLRCGQSSITLTRAGKVLIRGAYLLSRSSGVNRIKGGSVQIN